MAEAVLPRLAAEEEWCADLPVGALVRVSYDGETTDHMRVGLWPNCRRDRRGRMRGQST